MQLGYDRLVQLVNDGVINAPLENVKTCSIDVRLDNVILIENLVSHGKKIIDLSKVKEYEKNYSYEEKTIDDRGYVLDPGEFILASTIEVFNIPKIMYKVKENNNEYGMSNAEGYGIKGEFSLTSSLARFGLEQSLSISFWPGWSGKLIVEIKNQRQYYSLLIKPGMIIGQVEFRECDTIPDNAIYNGIYNGLSKVSTRT